MKEYWRNCVPEVSFSPQGHVFQAIREFLGPLGGLCGPPLGSPVRLLGTTLFAFGSMPKKMRFLGGGEGGCDCCRTLIGAEEPCGGAGGRGWPGAPCAGVGAPCLLFSFPLSFSSVVIFVKCDRKSQKFHIKENLCFFVPRGYLGGCRCTYFKHLELFTVLL